VSFIRNPFAKRDGYDCFGCSPDNPIGLKLQFKEDGEDIIADWEPQEHYQGWTNVLHGGIQASMLDEIGSWLVFVRLKSGCVTSRLDIRYRKPVPVNQGNITLRAHLKLQTSRIVEVEVSLFGPDGTLCSGGVASYFLFDKETAKEKLMFPDKEDAFTAV